MSTIIRKLGCWLTPVLFACSTAALAQQKPAGYPERPIRIIIGVVPGGGADFIARTTAQILMDRWGQNVVVDSRPGGGGVIGAGLAAKAPPDGYTLYQTGFALLVNGANKRVDFDVLKAFDPVLSLTTQPYVLLAHLSVPASSIKEVIAFSATKPLTYGGGGGIGATVHLGMERLASLSGMKLKYISYKGEALAILAAMGGEINLVVSTAMSAGSAIRGGKVRGVATMGAKRIAALPDLPTLAEQGVSGFTLTNRYDLRVPARTPHAIIAVLNRVIGDAMHAPQMVQRLAAEGTEPVERMTPAEFKAKLTREYAEVVQMVAELNRKTP